MKTDLKRKKRRRLLRTFNVLVLMALLIATNMFGTVPNNALSTGMREALLVALPAEFTEGLNQELEKYELPALSAPTEVTQAAFEPFVQPSGAIEPTPTVVFTSVPVDTPIPTVSAPPTRVPTIPPTPAQFVARESQLSMARTWNLWYPDDVDPDKYYRDVFEIEKQGDVYALASATSADRSIKLVDQSWDGDKLTWKYNVNRDDGGIDVVTVKTEEFSICGCGGLGYLLIVNITTGPDGFDGTEPIYEASMWADTELVPNADYSGNWEQAWLDTAGNTSFDHFAIEKQGDGYVVTSILDAEGNETPIISQSWDGEVLEWRYKSGDDTITIRTVGMDKAGILIASRKVSSWGDEFHDTGLFLEP
jgi:hypothetical protein